MLLIMITRVFPKLRCVCPPEGRLLLAIYNGGRAAVSRALTCTPGWSGPDGEDGRAATLTRQERRQRRCAMGRNKGGASNAHFYYLTSKAATGKIVYKPLNCNF